MLGGSWVWMLADLDALYTDTVASIFFLPLSRSDRCVLEARQFPARQYLHGRIESGRNGAAGLPLGGGSLGVALAEAIRLPSTPRDAVQTGRSAGRSEGCGSAPITLPSPFFRSHAGLRRPPGTSTRLAASTAAKASVWASRDPLFPPIRVLCEAEDW